MRRLVVLLFLCCLFQTKNLFLWKPLAIFAFSMRCLLSAAPYTLQSRRSAESVNPATSDDRRVLCAQHSPLWGRPLFIPVMSILLGISASLHTARCAQQCGEARARRVVVSVCQSQSQGSVSSHQSKRLRPDVARLPSPRAPPPHAVLFHTFLPHLSAFQ